MSDQLLFGDDDLELGVGDNGLTKPEPTPALTTIDEDELAKHIPIFTLLKNINEVLRSGEPIDSLMIQEVHKVFPIDNIGHALNMKSGPSMTNNAILHELADNIGPKVGSILGDIITNMQGEVEQLILLSDGIPLDMGPAVADLNLYIQNKVSNVIDDDLVARDIMDLPVRKAYEMLNKLQIYSGEMEALCTTIENELNMGGNTIREVMAYIDMLYGDFAAEVTKLADHKENLNTLEPDPYEGSLILEMRKEIFLASKTIRTGEPLFRNKRVLNAINEIFREKIS